MKILARLPDYRNAPSGAIVELNNTELAIITGGNQYAKIDSLKPGDAVGIHSEFCLSQAMLQKASEALKLPGILRAFADTLDTVKPKIDAIITPAQEPEIEEGT